MFDGTCDVILRRLIPKVVIATTPERQPPALEVHGRIASIREARETAQEKEAKFKVMDDHDLGPKFYPVLSSLQRFRVVALWAVAAGYGAEPFRRLEPASRCGLLV
jgi:hypothetical protein